MGWQIDGYWRPSYLAIEDGQVSIRRVDYALEHELAEISVSNPGLVRRGAPSGEVCSAPAPRALRTFQLLQQKLLLKELIKGKVPL